jgi:hypothetical protein
MKQQTIESISVGDQLPVLHKSADEAQLFLYSAPSVSYEPIAIFAHIKAI